MRVFIDSSVLFAAAFSPRGYARDLVLLGITGEVELFIGELVVNETRRNLQAKAPKAVPFFEQFLVLAPLHFVRPDIETIRDVATLIEVKDAAIVAGAMAAHADVLASYDRKHLIAHTALIADAFNITVDTPDNIVGRISGST